MIHHESLDFEHEKFQSYVSLEYFQYPEEKRHKYVRYKIDHKYFFFKHSNKDGSSTIKVPLSFKRIFIDLKTWSRSSI